MEPLCAPLSSSQGRSPTGSSLGLSSDQPLGNCGNSREFAMGSEEQCLESSCSCRRCPKEHSYKPHPKVQSMAVQPLRTLGQPVRGVRIWREIYSLGWKTGLPPPPEHVLQFPFPAPPTRPGRRSSTRNFVIATPPPWTGAETVAATEADLSRLTLGLPGRLQ